MGLNLMGRWSILVTLVLVVVVVLGKKIEGKGYDLPENCKELECAEYDVIETHNDFEIRSYRNAMWVSTSPINSTSYKDAASKGFEILFSYIEGNNGEAAKIPMTAPVLINIIPSTGNSSFVVQFYIPQKYQKNPPESTEAHPVMLPKHNYVAVRRFSGFMNDTNIPAEASELKKSLEGSAWEYVLFNNKKTTSEDYSVAGYNSPYEYDNRVNEVLLWFDK